MGFPMAGHLAQAGHDVTVFNRTRAKADAWVKQYGGKAAETPRLAAQGAEIVFSCVGNDNDLRKDLQTCLDEGRRNGALLPITAIIEQYYGKLQEKGYGRLDSSTLMKLLTEK